MVKRTDVVWYAMRITYSRELALKEYLDSISVECYVPMHYEKITYQGKERRKLVPVVHNLIFVHTSRIRLDEIKQQMECKFPMRYIMDRETQSPIIVPDSQMADFIAVTATMDEQLVFLDPVEVQLKKGDRVRITGGILKGVEGNLIRIKGDRRVVVSIQGIMAVGSAFIHPSLIEKIG